VLPVASPSASDAPITVEFVDQSQPTLYLNGPVIRLGRSPTADVVFPPNDTAISANHAKLVAQNDELIVFDTESKNGVYVNGRRVGRAKLNPGDVVRLGPTGPELRFSLGPASEKPSMAEALRQGLTVGMQAVVDMPSVGEAQVLGEFPLGAKPLRLGRAEDCEVRLDSMHVSAHHAEVSRDPSGTVRVRDLGSTNGTFCRGARIDRQELEDGDKILVGSGTVLKFTYHDNLDEVFQRQMYESALRDDLTKIFNKKYFTDRVESEFAYAARQRGPLALVTFDLDHFKQVNDTYGHPAGDYVLSEMAAAIQATVRVEDVFARVGGEEFSIICRGADVVQGQIIAERVRQTVGTHAFVFGGKSIPVTVSAGVAAVQDPRIHDAAGLIAAADHALYEAKRRGRDRVCLWR
jgi:diguanylate cyclase (GGDEF)-like protein